MSMNTPAVRFRPRSRIPAIASLLVGCIAIVGEGVVFRSSSEDAFALGMWVVVAASVVSGATAALIGNPLPNMFAPKRSLASRRQISTQFASVKLLGLPLLAEIVGGEIIVLIALATGATRDMSDLSLALMIGGVVGGCSLLLGLLIGWIVLWPILSLLALLTRRVTCRPFDELTAAISVLLLDVVGLGITLTLATGAVKNVSLGPGLFTFFLKIGYLVSHYSGDASLQVASWLARVFVLLFGVVLAWLIREIGAYRVQHANDPDFQTEAPMSDSEFQAELESGTEF